MDTPNPKRVSYELPASWERIKYLTNRKWADGGGMDHRKSHSLGEMEQRKLLIHLRSYYRGAYIANGIRGGKRKQKCGFTWVDEEGILSYLISIDDAVSRDLDLGPALDLISGRILDSDSVLELDPGSVF
ncbi:hypothetical protein EVAR_12586_1 [Eumeta japonica]|uniref:Uncharacterized protein n=1 Tax=Eumeta variegata TaxID=151549 RepID=A0A4C1UFJ9_EUMVA|nr:hypothetical protein EVAR_12586_1 [Eumeta japonica]